MKRLLALIFALAVLLTLAACGKDEKKTVFRDRDDDDEDKRTEQPTTLPFEEIIVLDTPEYLVRITDWSRNYLYVSFENRSDDTTYRFDSNGCTFNGLCTSVSFYERVAPGETGSGSVWLSTALQADIGTVTDIGLNVTVTNTDTYDLVDSKTVHYYPLGEEEATRFQRQSLDTDIPLLDQSEISAVLTGYTLNENHFTAQLFLTNNSQKPLTVRFADEAINGYVMNISSHSFTLLPDSCQYASLSWNTSDLQNAGIRKVEQISADLTVVDADHSDDTIAQTELSLTPEKQFIPKVENEASIEPITIFDTANFFVQISDFTVRNGTPVIHIYYENRSRDYAYVFEVEDVFINGLDVSPYNNLTLEPGRKSHNQVSIPLYGKEELLTDFTDISVRMSVRLEDKWEDLDTNTVHIYPLGQEKASVYHHKVQVSDHLVLDNQYITMVVTDCGASYDGGISVGMYFENKTQEEMYIYWSGVTVNGIEKNPWYDRSLPPGTSIYLTETWYRDFLDENNITTVDQISLTLSLKTSQYSGGYHSPSYFSETIDLLTEPFTLPETE